MCVCVGARPRFVCIVSAFPTVGASVSGAAVGSASALSTGSSRWLCLVAGGVVSLIAGVVGASRKTTPPLVGAGGGDQKQEL